MDNRQLPKYGNEGCAGDGEYQNIYPLSEKKPIIL